MYSITLNVENEEELYSSFDPQRNLLSDEVKSYLGNRLQLAEGVGGVELHVCSRKPVDEERFKEAIDRWSDEEGRSLRSEARRNRVQQVWMFGLGVLFITLSLMLESRVNVVVFTVLSTIGAFSIWEATSIWIVRNPTLRLKKKIAARLKSALTYRFTLRG